MQAIKDSVVKAAVHAKSPAVRAKTALRHGIPCKFLNE